MENDWTVISCHLNVEFDEIEGESGGGVEGGDGVFFDGRHSAIGGLEHVHAVTTVTDDDEFRQFEGGGGAGGGVGEAGGVEGEGGALRHVIEAWDVGDMNGLESSHG